MLNSLLHCLVPSTPLSPHPPTHVSLTVCVCVFDFGKVLAHREHLVVCVSDAL